MFGWRWIGVHPHSLQQVGSVKSRSPYRNQHLFGIGLRYGYIGDAQHFWPAMFGEHYCAHMN